MCGGKRARCICMGEYGRVTLVIYVNRFDYAVHLHKFVSIDGVACESWELMMMMVVVMIVVGVVGQMTTETNEPPAGRDTKATATPM